jgi:hypothetical protein
MKTEWDVFDLCEAVDEALETDAHDEVVVGVNPEWESWVRAAWPAAQVLARGGPDGADKALCAYAKTKRIHSCGAVWIASGDGGLLEVAKRATRLERRVVVMSRPKQLSRRLSLAVDRTVDFTWTTPRAAA